MTVVMKLNDKLVALYKKIKSNVKITLCHCTLRSFFLKDLTFFTFFTSKDSSFQFLIVLMLKVRPPSVFFLKNRTMKI